MGELSWITSKSFPFSYYRNSTGISLDDFFFASAEDQSEEHLFEVFLFWGEPKFGKVRQNLEGMDFSWSFMAAGDGVKQD